MSCPRRMAIKAHSSVGAFTDVVILPGGGPNELKELRAALYDKWNPEGPTEIDKVESIAMGMWRKRRFQRYLQKTFGKFVGIGDAFLRMMGQIMTSW